MVGNFELHKAFNILRGSESAHSMRGKLSLLIILHYMVEQSILLGEDSALKVGYHLHSKTKLSDYGSTNIKQSLTSLIQEVNSQLCVEFDISIFDNLSEGNLYTMVQVVSHIDFGSISAGDVFMQIIVRTSELEGKAGGEYYTPFTLAQLVISLIDMENIKTVYDPTMGVGSLLQGVSKHNSQILLYGQEINKETYHQAIMHSIVSDNWLQCEFRLGDTLYNPKRYSEMFDLIVSNCPFGLKFDPEQLVGGVQDDYKYISRIGDIAFIQHALSQLSDNGKYIAIVPNGVLFRGGTEQDYRESLLNEGVIECVIALPAGLFSHRGISCFIIVFNKQKVASGVQFIDAIDLVTVEDKNRILSQDNIQRIVESYQNRIDEKGYSVIKTKEEIIATGSNLLVTCYIDKFGDQFRNIQANYPEYKEYSFDDVVDFDLIDCKENDNLYFMRKNGIDLKKIYSHGEKVSLEGDGGIDKNTSFISFQFNENLILPSYFQFFVKSEMGELALKELEYRSTSLVSRYGYADNTAALKTLRIIVPPIDEQKKIISAYLALEKVINNINEIKKDLVVSPYTADQAIEQSYKVLVSLEALTQADEILEIIRTKEGNIAEFKETLHYNEKANKQKDEDLITSAFKNIVAFLNTKGGTLLVGVHDHGTIIGIERDLKQYQNTDKLLLYIKDKLIARIGEQYLQYIDYNLVNVDGKIVLRFDCSTSEIPCYLDERRFYFKAKSSAEELAGNNLQSYIKTRFK